MSTTMGQIFHDNLLTCRNTNLEELKTFFDITQKLILDLKNKILNVSTIDWTFSPSIFLKAK